MTGISDLLVPVAIRIPQAVTDSMRLERLA